MMAISGDFTSIVAGTTQTRLESRKPQQSEQGSTIQFGDVLKKSKDDNLAALSDSKRLTEQADANKKYLDKIANEKAANDRALSNKQSNDKALSDKTTNAKLASDKAASSNAEQAASSKNKVAEKNYDNKKDEKLKSSSQEEQNASDASAASSINDYLSQLNSPKTSTTKDGGHAALHTESDGGVKVAETDSIDGKNNDSLNSQLLSVKEKMDKLTTVGNAASDQSDAGKMANAGDEVKNAQKPADGQSTLIDKNMVQAATIDSDSNSAKGKNIKDIKTQSTANGDVTDAQLKGVDRALQKKLDESSASLTNGKDSNSLSGKLAGTAQANAHDKVKAVDKDSTGKIDDKNSVKNRDGFTELKKGDIDDIKTDDKSDDTLSGRKQTSSRRVHNGAYQAVNNTNQQANVDSASDKLHAAPALNVGDKVAVTGKRTERRDVFSRIADVEVTENRKVGDIRVLRIKLNPENLGMVEARLRKTSDGLQIEIHAERQETAHLLAADRHMLGKALEKSGFNDDGRLTILIVDKSSQTVQQGQTSNSGQSTPQDNNGQNFNGQRQFSGQQGQGGHNGSRQTFTEFPFTGTPLQEENVGQEAAYRNPRHLVV